MTGLLREGARLRFSGTATPARVIRLLGGGGQGQVFEVEFAGEPMALKWYFPGCLDRDPGLKERLRQCTRSADPNGSFLWPILVLDATPDCRRELAIPETSFGYVMKLRPPEFVAAVEHNAGRIAISLRQLLRVCFHLAEAFHALHSKGLCYKDISLGNLFLDPASGRILICDNDNVDVNGSDLSGVSGTPGFMAPEVLLGRSRPGTASDLFSLAVLLFRLLTRHDPFRGLMELEIRCLDAAARRRLYGEDPVFIFDPVDGRNRPDEIEHPAPLRTWPIYPTHLQALLQQSLGRGARDPARRVYTSQWMKALSRCLDQQAHCPHCHQEVFPEPGVPGHCWDCSGSFPPAGRLIAPAGVVLAQPGNELHRHHFDPLAAERIDAPLGRIEVHPHKPGVLGLLNLGDQPWSAELRSGGSHSVEPGKRCNLALLSRLHTPLGPLAMVP
ncbi:MAG: protein kinase domain-containing protein [Synechococcaceae cyanobacterium]